MDMSLSTAQKSLLKTVGDQEKRLKSFKNDTITHAAEILGLQEELRENYQCLILQHPDYGTSVVCKEVEEKLWKQCFYIKIEEYRKSIRKTLTLRDEKENMTANSAAASLALKARTHLAKLVAAFTKFLSDGSSFYQDLMLKLESGYKGYEQRQQSNATGRSKENFILCIYRCLMYLGDLARYRELYSDNKDKNYSEAERYYERASFLSETSGHPHNQMAVLASYLEKDCIAVYHYCRSVMISKPFISGFDNLGLIFDKNMRAYSTLLTQGPSLPTQQLISEIGFCSRVSLKDKKKSISTMAQSLLIRFVRLHGDLFKWTHTTVKAIDERQKAANADLEDSATPAEDSLKVPLDPYVASEFDSTKFLSLVQEVLSDFEYFMQNDESSIFSEIFLVRLLAVSLFSVHHASSLFCENQSKSSESLPSDRSITKSLALYFLFNFISRCATLYGMIPTCSNKTIELNARRVLPVLTVFAEWCSLNPEYLGCSSLESDPRSDRRGRTGEKISLKEKEKMDAMKVKMIMRRTYYTLESVRPSDRIIKIEEEAKESMRSCLSSLEEFITLSLGAGANNLLQKGRSKHQESKALLKEEIELRGFFPLKKVPHEISSEVKGLVVIQPATVPEELARNRRLKDLAFFVYKIKRCSFVDTIVQQPPTGSNNITANGSSHAISANSNGYEIDKKYDTPVRDIESDNKESRAGILTASPGLMISAQQKVKERERNIERFCSKMEDLRERISEDKEIRDQSGKKGRLEDFPSGDILIEKKEQVAGLLSIGPGVLVAARQKGKDRERNIERDRSSKIRGERRPGSKLVETRTSSSGKSSSRRERRSAATAVTGGDTNRPKGNVRNQTEIQRHHKVKAAQADFPPLPGAREPSPQTAALNYASSALFTPTAPVLLDPFADDDSEGSENSSDSDNDNDSDDSRDEEDDNYNDDLNEEEDKDDAGLDDFSKPDLDSMIEGDPLPSYDGDNWNIATSINAPNLHTTIIPPAFGGLFSRPANASSTGSLFSEYSAQMDLGPSMSTAHQGPYEEDDDDDFADDVVVFRPAFSRFSASPAPSIKQSMTSGVNSISPMPTLLSYPLNATLGQPYDSKEMEFTGMNQNKPQHSMESIRSMFSDTYNSNQTQPQPLRKIDHWQNNGIYDPSIESMKAFPCQPVASSDIFRNVNSGCPMEVPMGTAFGRSTGFEYSCKEQDMNFTSDTNTPDEWWKGTDNSMETQPCTAILSSPPPMEYVGMRSTRGPPALQHVPHGSLNTTNSMISRNPIPQHPPGLVQPPPGFGSMTDRKSNSENNLQSMQYQQQQQQPYRDSSNDLWTANPFYRSNG